LEAGVGQVSTSIFFQESLFPSMGRDRYKVYYQGAVYHIYNRGVGRQDIFVAEDDYRFYLRRLKEYLAKYEVALLAFSLLPNHIHLVPRQNLDIPISKFIQSLHTSYVAVFNKRYARVGPLFQDRFKCKNVETDRDLEALVAYVHLNPLLAGLVGKAEDWPWSSYSAYLGEEDNSPCELETVLKGRPGREYKEFIESQIERLKNLKKLKELIE
jgi:putative transposase